MTHQSYPLYRFSFAEVAESTSIPVFSFSDSSADNQADQTKRYIYSPTGLYPAPIGKNTKSSHMTKLKNKFRLVEAVSCASFHLFNRLFLNILPINGKLSRDLLEDDEHHKFIMIICFQDSWVDSWRRHLWTLGCWIFLSTSSFTNGFSASNLRSDPPIFITSIPR